MNDRDNKPRGLKGAMCFPDQEGCFRCSFNTDEGAMLVMLHPLDWVFSDRRVMGVPASANGAKKIGGQRPMHSNLCDVADPLVFPGVSSQ